MAGGKDLADALVELDGGGKVESDASKAALRERRRVRRWAIATIVLWIAAAAYFLVLLWLYLVFIHPILNEYLTNPAAQGRNNIAHGNALIMGLKALLLWPCLLALAAVSTTLFTLTSRRATLRQIQISLADISAELKRLAGS